MIGSFFWTILTAPLDLLYWIKWAVAYCAVRIHNGSQRSRFDLYDINALGDPVKLGFVVPQLERDLESPSSEEDLQEYADEVFVYGVNSKSECLLVRVSRAPNQVSDAWIYLKLANGKSYSLAESAGHQQPYEGGKCTNFSCGKLQIHYLAPMRQWRIFYCGMLKETSSVKDNGGESVFVKFVFLWKASSGIYDFTMQSNPDGFVNAMARTKWEYPYVPPTKNAEEAFNFYAQSGIVNGTVSVNDGDEYELYLFGEKMRNLGKSSHFSGCNFTNLLGNVPSNGFTLHLGKATVPHIVSNMPYGFIVQPDATLRTVQELEIKIRSHNDSPQKSMKAIFNAGGPYEVRGRVLSDPIVLYSGQGWSGFVEISFIRFTVGGKRGSGIIIQGQIYKTEMVKKKPKEASTVIKFPESVPLTVAFSNEISHFREISGGKGSSLGKLTELSYQEKTFIVPKGLIVTTAAYQEFLTPEILNAVKYLEDVVYGNITGDVKEACNAVSGIIERTLLPPKICHSITDSLKHLLGGDANQYKFAVRSSATGEDTSAMSAAGQMDTFLGVQGFKEVFLYVKKCWASQFGHIAVEYKRRYGQPLNCPMAVVIQEMVASQVSGVLFTCDPVTNNPATVTITANYGLGETVVSGSVEPDTITLRRDEHNHLEYDAVLVGSKLEKLVMQESGGTVSEKIPEDSRGDSCLTIELALRLGNISLKIEEYYRSSRDIEWGILNNNVYILQSRPVTNAAAETDFEIKHEMDAPVRCENEYFTVANVGEDMPGATSPLGINLVCRYIGNVLKREAIKKGAVDNFGSSYYYPTGLLAFYNHMMMTATDVMNRYGFDTPMSKGFMISIFGRVLDDPDFMDFAQEKAPPGAHFAQPSIRQILQCYWDLYFLNWGTEKVKQKIFSYHLNFTKQRTSVDIFRALLNSCSDFDEALLKHFNSSESSSSWNMAMFKILSDVNEGNFDTDAYSDFARLLSISSQVESESVPQAMQEVAVQIGKDIDAQQFKSMSDEEALKWLKETTSPAGQKFHQFITRHGYRCVKEFDVRSVTWEMNPKLLVKGLQTMVGSVKDIKHKESDDCNKIFTELNMPLGFISRLRLKFVLSMCRKAVQGREDLKPPLMKSIDHWRQGYWMLAKQMVAEGRIPEEDLLFFMLIDEIKELLETRSPTIIARALHRKKIFPTLDDYIFPEIMRGIPKPTNESAETADTYEFVADLTMKGIPVSQGVIKGYARVAISLEEASHIQKGEILITYSTDIGWSPYFSIISGLVTELGGIVSHGVVVSREYGLPCVVGLAGATKRFRTGDYVLLDGKKGILQRLPQPE
ncbi:hypothetical protein JTE90_013544 [Oedothorax gibbosus]|uniref:Phosphoenolpyruvate synthase n=1 Tax=Oedothorax gibbosus TaxID=931172 RepID=A0AAV6U8K4_9ARAC|nr:hypothetical protein JTE90_013544 [Oedothorax gibbosus]